MAQDPQAAAGEEKKQGDAAPNVLMVLTNCNAITDRAGKHVKQTGWYLPEVAHPYAAFAAAGFGMTFASIKGGECEMDFGSFEDTCLGDKADKESVAFFELMRASDASEMKRDDAPKCKALANIKAGVSRDESGSEKDRKVDKLTLATVSFTALQGREAEFDIIFFAGGHGTAYDFVDSNPKHDIAAKKDTRDMHAFAAKIYENKDKPGVVAAVCHGPMALIDLALSDGTMLVKDKNVTGFTNKEEDAAKLSDIIPQSLEDGLKKSGGKFVGKDNWAAHAIADKGVVTGQNPQSAAVCAKACVEELANRRKK